jgi:extracellular elastinolytic metalloproteinase
MGALALEARQQSRRLQHPIIVVAFIGNSMKRLSLVVLLAMAGVAPLHAQGAAEFQRPAANIHRGTAAQPLTLPSNASPVAVVAQYLRAQGRNDGTASSIVAAAQSEARNGVAQLRLEQRVNGLLVHDGYVKAAIGARGELIHVIDGLANVPPGRITAPSVDEKAALLAALNRLYPDDTFNPSQVRRNGDTVIFARGTFFAEEPSVTKVAIPMSDGSLVAGYAVTTWRKQGNLLHETLIAGDGRVLSVEVRTNNDSYNVFPESPAANKQTIVTNPADANASPSGWLAGAQTTVNIGGNNVRAYLDRNNDNAADAGGTAVTTGNFVAAADLKAYPTVATNQAVSVQNLFYLNNFLHDRLYKYGFNEAAGNFQNDNFGRGGASGSDAVNAEAQDGGGTDNANFATPRDGSAPRMQMYLFTIPGLASHQVVVNGRAYDAAPAEFGRQIGASVSGALALVNDGVATVTDGCEALARNSLTGKVAIIDRGSCEFETKVKNAETAGAVAAIVANNAGTTEIVPMGEGTQHLRVTIPSVMVSKRDGGTLKGLVGQIATLQLTSPAPMQIDAALDSDVVYHEYCHGLTWRMIGNMSGPMAGAIGEGMSDVCALLFNDDPVMGEYATSNPVTGIRSAAYDNYTRTYKDWGGTEIHFDGEIYGAIGWAMWSNFKAAGVPVDTVFTYVVDGMNYTPSGPTVEQMRDGILQSIANSGNAHSCHVWRAFAQYGVGVGASAVVRGGTVSVTESKTVPAGC